MLLIWVHVYEARDEKYCIHFNSLGNFYCNIFLKVTYLHLVLDVIVSYTFCVYFIATKIL